MSATHFLRGDPTTRRIFAFLIAGFTLLVAAVLATAARSTASSLRGLLPLLAVTVCGAALAGYLFFGGDAS